MKNVFEKKEYRAPKMTIVDMKYQTILCGSDELNADSYDDEFGFNLDADRGDRQV